MSASARPLVLFALIAVVMSAPRFGQRENERAPVSDSDYYLDMAAVFAGDQARFDPIWSAAGSSGAHHYARPLLPFVAGRLARILPGVGPRAAFSLVNLIAAWSMAVALYLFVARADPTVPPWLPGALFLTGFPQINWGYHLLTDTVGYATAFVTALAAWALVRWHRIHEPRLTDLRLLGMLAALFALQAVAFLARETGWMVPVIVVWLLFREGFPRRGAGFGCAVLSALLFAALPRQLYVERLALHPIAFSFLPRAWLDPWYVLDFLVKSAVAFHLLWGWSVLGLRSRRGAVPDLLWGWAIAALLYMGAGYVHNSVGGVGYPLRLSYALFPLIYFLAARGLTQLGPGRRLRAGIALVGLNAAVGLGGTWLDSGASGLTVQELVRPQGLLRP